MKKITILLSAVLCLTISCKKKGNYTCHCITPYGTQADYPYSGEYKNALGECSNWQNKYNATTAYVGTKCALK